MPTLTTFLLADPAVAALEMTPDQTTIVIIGLFGIILILLIILMFTVTPRSNDPKDDGERRRP